MLSAFSTRDLQTVLAVLRMLDDQNDPMAMIEQCIEKRTQPTSLGAVRQADMEDHCPSPGCSGRLYLCPVSSRIAGVPVKMCRKCGYSRMETANGI